MVYAAEDRGVFASVSRNLYSIHLYIKTTVRVVYTFAFMILFVALIMCMKKILKMSRSLTDLLTKNSLFVSCSVIL